ncbi:hypothetical protein K525DRAFT_274778 [Schizophyllum commune Loenen D]|nr:hypothetical protein K525DRAFT_274778 [Schizophyllum commune Loenen D]
MVWEGARAARSAAGDVDNTRGPRGKSLLIVATIGKGEGRLAAPRRASPLCEAAHDVSSTLGGPLDLCAPRMPLPRALPPGKLGKAQLTTGMTLTSSEAIDPRPASEGDEYMYRRPPSEGLSPSHPRGAPD